MKSSVIIFKVDIESIRALERKRDSPVAAHSYAPRSGAIAFQPMQAIAGQVHVRSAASAIKHVQLS